MNPDQEQNLRLSLQLTAIHAHILLLEAKVNAVIANQVPPAVLKAKQATLGTQDLQEAFSRAKHELDTLVSVAKIGLQKPERAKE